MKLFRRLFNDEVSEIIKLTELKQEVKNLLFVIVYEIQHRNTKYGKEWNYSVTSQHRSQGFDYMITQIRELLKENEQLKEKLKQQDDLAQTVHYNACCTMIDLCRKEWDIKGGFSYPAHPPIDMVKKGATGRAGCSCNINEKQE